MKFISLLLCATCCTLLGQGINPYQAHPPIAQFKDAVVVGQFDSSANWQEISGMATPTVAANANYMWIISDSPANMLAAVSLSNASPQGVWTLTSPPAYSDWEDIASAKINGQSYLYIADFGDNGNARSTFNIFRCKEPTITGSNGSIAAIDYETITCQFPSAPTHKDCETLLIDPDTGDMYIVTKRITPPVVYMLAHAPSYAGTQTLTLMGNMYSVPTVQCGALGTLPACNVVAGTIHRSGNEILIKNYDKVYYFARRNKAVSIYTTLTQTPVEVAYVGGGTQSPVKAAPMYEPQGESIAYDFVGQNYYTASEYYTPQGSTATRYPMLKYDRVAAAPTTIVFQEGVSPTGAYAGTLDTYIWDTAPTTDNGAVASLVIDTAIGVETDQRKMLLKFDISAIPVGSRVVSANLELYINTEGQGYKLHKMLVPFVEASTYTSLTGGIDNDGIDAAVAYDALNGLYWDTLTGAFTNWVNIATVQSWVDNPSTNYGWLIEQVDSSTGDGIQVDSAEGATPSRRPKLTIKYN